MAKSVVSYDKELPEIPGRCAWQEPTSFLVKDEEEPSGFRVDTSGRRASPLLLVKKLRERVGAWRAAGYEGASDVAKRLFGYWFDEDHQVAGFAVPFRYHFCQREAIETLVYLVEIAGEASSDAVKLIGEFGEVFKHGLFSKSIVFQTTMDGARQIRRYVDELDVETEQDLPPEDLRRYAFRMATGSGKTWVMAMAMVWSYFHKRRVAGSQLSTNFLIVAPNIIVFQRLEKDFGNNEIFYNLPLIPPEWGRGLPLKVIKRDESTAPDASGNLFLTNVQQLYEGRAKPWEPANAVQALLGPAPRADAASYQPSILERLKGLRDLVVINDEAHHVHDHENEWSKSLLGIHAAIPDGVALWLDFSATPRDQGGRFFPWTVVDYPLAQAVEDRIVKAPIIVTLADDPKRPQRDPEDVTKETVVRKCGFWIRAAVERWKEHTATYAPLGQKPVLFIMAEKNDYADAIGAYLCETAEFGLKTDDVCIIHTDRDGDVKTAQLDEARAAVRNVDRPDSKLKAIVSVMMLREGWDVRNVTVVLGLRPFTAKAEILPEQVIGRGLRKLVGIGPDETQTLEVLGTQNLLNVLKEQLEAEGVGVVSTSAPPAPPITIMPVQEKLAYDIAIPFTKPRLTRNTKKLGTLDPMSLEPVYDQAELPEALRIHLRMEFATTSTEVHQAQLDDTDLPIAAELISTITKMAIRWAGLSNVFAELFPIVRAYIQMRCFGSKVDIDELKIRSNLRRPEVQEGIAKYLAREIGKLTAEKREIEFEDAERKLSDTHAFQWRRNQPPPCAAKRTVFNYVATYNKFERDFAGFLDDAKDVARFASLGTTEQGQTGTAFRVDYLKPSGAIGFYHPDWIAVQKTKDGEVNWILETKGRVWEGTLEKDAAMLDWCARVSEQTGQKWEYERIDQRLFEQGKTETLAALIRAARGDDLMF